MGLGVKREEDLWVAWDKVCNSKEAGRHDIINVKRFNMALLGKWIWCLNLDKGGCGGRSSNLSMVDGEA